MNKYCSGILGKIFGHKLELINYTDVEDDRYKAVLCSRCSSTKMVSKVED